MTECDTCGISRDTSPLSDGRCECGGNLSPVRRRDPVAAAAPSGPTHWTSRLLLYVVVVALAWVVVLLVGIATVSAYRAVGATAPPKDVPPKVDDSALGCSRLACETPGPGDPGYACRRASGPCGAPDRPHADRCKRKPRPGGRWCGRRGEWLTASAYGVADGLLGRRTADGTVVQRDSMLVASMRLALGTRVKVCVDRGRCVRAVVRDRGGFERLGRQMDLGPGVWAGLGFRDEWAFGERRVHVTVLLS
jgi:hypothetical protein